MLYMATRPRKPVGISNIFFRSTHGSRSVASMLEASRMPPNGRRLNPSDTMCWCSPKLTSRPTWFTRTSTLSPTFTLSGAQECLKNTTPGWLSWSNVPLVGRLKNCDGATMIPATRIGATIDCWQMVGHQSWCMLFMARVGPGGKNTNAST